MPTRDHSPTLRFSRLRSTGADLKPLFTLDPRKATQLSMESVLRTMALTFLRQMMSRAGFIPCIPMVRESRNWVRIAMEDSLIPSMETTWQQREDYSISWTEGSPV